MDFLNRLKIRLFGPTAGTGQAQSSSGSIPAPANHWTPDPVIAGCQFYATLELRVPLEVLRHHGEMFQGPLEGAPRYGNWIDDKYSADGIWLLKTKSWAQLATRNIEAAAALDRETSKSPQHSDIGLILAEKYLPFLLAFREIVEGESEVPEKVDRVKALAKTYRTIYKKVTANHPGFPESFFLEKPKHTRRKTMKAN